MTGWPLVSLSELLMPVSRPESLIATKRYRLLGAHWYAEGLYIKDTKPGSEIQATQLSRIEASDFVYNRLFAWKGAFAVAGEDVAGCYVSNEFPCFRVNEERLDRRFLRYYFARESVWNKALGLSTGGTPTSRNRLKEERLLAMTIPLPTLQEQRRIVARIENLSELSKAVAVLRQQIVTDTNRLLISLAHRLDLTPVQKLEAGWQEIVLSEVLKRCDEPHPVQSDKEYPNLGIYSYGRGLFPKVPISGASTSASTLHRVRSGQFIYSRLFAFEGAYSVVGTEFDGCFVSNEYPVFECDAGRITAEFLRGYFLAPNVWRMAAANSRGLGDRRQRVQPEQILKMRILLPPLHEQHILREVAKKTLCLVQEHDVASDRHTALLPSILHQSFGNL
jgi:type I restriction enzyme S subunit